MGIKKLKMPAVATVDGFQGLEKDLIILSLVRSKGDSVGFIDSFKRLNVAITRAKFGLIVIGDVDHIRKSSKNEDFKDLINYYRIRKALFDVEDIQKLYKYWFDEPSAIGTGIKLSGIFRSNNGKTLSEFSDSL